MSDKHEVQVESPEPGVVHVTVNAPAADLLHHPARVHRAIEDAKKDED